MSWKAERRVEIKRRSGKWIEIEIRRESGTWKENNRSSR